MEKIEISKFVISSLEENGFVKFYVTCREFKGRIKKHVGKGVKSDYYNHLVEIRRDIEKYFEAKTVSKESVHNFVNEYVKGIKQKDSLFNFSDEFILMKRAEFNAKTEHYLSDSSINSYLRAIDSFRKFLKSKGLSELPEVVNKSVLNDYFQSLAPLARNYRVKMHSRVKGYINYLFIEKRLCIDPSYMDSKFSQQYDNQQYDEADRSLTSDEMDKLIMLRNDFKKGVIQITAYKKSKTIPEKVQIKQRIQKMNNLKRTLDCFLFMCSTGLYLADIEKVGLSIRNVDNKVSYMTYRRAKNDSYCKGILIKDFGCFLGKTLIMEYGIKSGSNFPMKLSRNHVGKNLKIISELVGFDFYITSKMARKTFASLYFFIYDLGINDVQMMLGHKDSKQTMHYLRITDDDLALRIHEKIKQIA